MDNFGALLLTVLPQVLPLFGCLALGALMAWRKWISHEGSNGLSSFVYWIAFPCLLFATLADSPPPNGAMVHGLILYGAAMAFVLFLASALARLLRFDAQSQCGVPIGASLGNSAFMGLPIITHVLGPAFLPIGASVVAVDFTVVFFLGLLSLAFGASHASDVPVQNRHRGHILIFAFKKAVSNPAIWGAILGGLVALIRLPIPEPLMHLSHMAGSAASPVALTVLGAVLYFEVAEHGLEFRPDVLLTCGLKLILAPALVMLVLMTLKAPADLLQTATILAGTSTAVSVFIQARALKVWDRGGAQTVALSTLFSLISLPLLITAILAHG